MSDGNVAEFDTPANLLRKQGVFYDLVQKTGEENAKKLMQAALLAEQQRKEGKKVEVDFE